MSKGKIVLVGTAHPYRGGLASYNERLMTEFQNQGYAVEIFTFTLQYPNFLFPGKSQYSSSPAPENLNITRNINAVNPLNWIKVGKQLKRMKPEMVIIKYWLPFMGPCLGKIARVARKNKYTKIIAIIDNIIPHEKRRGDKLFSKYFVKSVDGFIAMSKSVLEDLKKFDTNKPKLFNPHPLFDNFGRSISKEKACKSIGIDASFNYILFFGFVRDYKGLDLLLAAFGDERFRNKNIKLIIAGEYYSNAEKYQDLIKGLNLSNEIIQKTEFIADEDVKNYFCAADIVAQPYKSATQSGVTQIGYHFEKPMLVTNVGGLAEIIPHKKIGYVVAPKSEEIADALIEFYENGEKAIFEENIKEEKKKFTWDKMLERIEEVKKIIG